MQPSIKLVLALVSLFLAAAGPAVGQSGPAHVFIQVEGLGCPFCVHGLDKHLKKLASVEAVTISLKEGEAVLHLKPGKTVEEKELREAVKKAGFTADKIRFKKGPTETKPEKRGGSQRP